MGTQESEVYMSTHKPKLIEELAQEVLEQIQEIKVTLEEKPDREDVERWTSDLEFKMEEVHEDVRDLQGELAEVSAQVDDLYSEDR
jgi:polyhydroxyalkanoate synthesis regulator phasin